jgi:type IV secretion system protein VirB10
MAPEPVKRLPTGNDPRLSRAPDDLDAATRSAMPQVARGGNDAVALALGVVGIAAVGAFTFVGLHNAPHKAQPVPPPPAPVAQPIPSAPQPVPVAPAPQSLLTPPPVTVAPVPAPVQPIQDPNAARAPAMIIDNSTPAAPAQAAAASAPPQAAKLNSNDQFINSVNGTIANKAWKIGDPSKVVPQGTMIPAVLETAINSDLPGYTRAIVSRDIRSFDGSAVLVPRGSRLVGQYKSGLTTGETRAFIIWDRLIRPDGLSVQLASPATDDLGQAGSSGNVDNHFVTRFGAAVLLSIVNGLASGLSKNNSTIVIGSSTEASSIANSALQANVSVPPTIHVPQGTPIEVFAARDLDFALGNQETK